MLKSRVRRVGALIVGLSLVAAACGGDDDDDAEPVEDTAAEDTAAEDTTEDTSEEMPDETTAPSGEDDGILRIGGLLPETGNLAFLGPPEFAGVELAVQEINEAGGVLGNPVEYSPGDSGDNAEVANATVDRLLAEDVDAFIGAASSSVSLTVIDKITQAGKIQFSPANTSAAFIDYDDNGLYFRTAPNDEIQGGVLAQTIIDDGNATAGFLVLNDAYGTDLLDFTKAAYTDAGGEVVLEQIYDPQAETFDAEVASMVEADPDAVVLIGFDETSQILGGLIEAGFGPADKDVYGVDGNMGNALAESFDDPSVVAGMKGTLPGVDVAGTLDDFQARLLEVDPELIDYSYSAESYDAVVITALAASIAGSTVGTEIAEEINGVTRDGEKCTTFADCIALVDAGTDIDYDGVSGELEFVDVGEPSVASVLILEFDENGEIFVAGSDFASLAGS